MAIISGSPTNGNDNIVADGANDFINSLATIQSTVGAAMTRSIVVRATTASFGFTFNAPNQGVDRITDFVVADSIRVLATGFGGGLVAGAAIGVCQFRIGATATDASDRFIYNDTNGNLFFDSDGVGGVTQVKLAKLAGAPTISNADIVVI